MPGLADQTPAVADLAEELPDWVFRLWASGNEWNTQELVMARMEVPGGPAADRRVPGHGSSERIAADECAPQITALLRAASRNHSALSFGVRSRVSKST